MLGHHFLASGEETFLLVCSLLTIAGTIFLGIRLILVSKTSRSRISLIGSELLVWVALFIYATSANDPLKSLVWEVFVYTNTALLALLGIFLFKRTFYPWAGTDKSQELTQFADHTRKPHY